MNNFLIFAVLIILSGFSSGVETAYTSLSRYRIERMIADGERYAGLVERLKQNEYKLLVTILILNNLINIAAAAIATVAATDMFGSRGIGIATGVTTFLILVFGEITPKTIAIRHNAVIARYTALPLTIIRKALAPVAWIFLMISRGIAKSFGLFEKRSPELTEEELVSAIKASAREGAIKKVEKDIITKVFAFDDIDVREIMTPRTDMISVRQDKKLSAVIDHIIKSKHSRIPVMDKRAENVVGFLYVKDILKNMKQRKLNVPVTRLMREPFFVPEVSTIDNLLMQFKNKKHYMAIVVDEHGAVAGLVTFKDIIAEIVGEIVDVTDEQEKLIVQVNQSTYRVNAKASLALVNKRLNVGLPESEDYDTIGGFVLAHLSRIPRMREELSFGTYTIRISKMEKQRILELLITKGRAGSQRTSRKKGRAS